jgi:hypothetical protein
MTIAASDARSGVRAWIGISLRSCSDGFGRVDIGDGCPSQLADALLEAAFRSAWMGIIVHSAQRDVIRIVVLVLVP